jgi:hypothetical protein
VQYVGDRVTQFGFRNDRWDVAFYINNFTDKHACLEDVTLIQFLE